MNYLPVHGIDQFTTPQYLYMSHGSGADPSLTEERESISLAMHHVDRFEMFTAQGVFRFIRMPDVIGFLQLLEKGCSTSWDRTAIG